MDDFPFISGKHLKRNGLVHGVPARGRTDIRKFPRLNCYLNLTDDGALALISGSPGNQEGRIWGTNGKANRPKPHPVPFHFYVAVEDGKMRIYREKPGHPKVVVYETRSVPESGSYQLGVTASKRLAVFRKNGNKNDFLWRSPMRN